ncbi:hypothetical protein [Thiofilum flexile]|uniref:hypothetical protein n=1 Tax=Thiofilum flexile TaxID=125627 RepID=UPI00036681FF|nr:hypothetical protein [Thiofilum flexile]
MNITLKITSLLGLLLFGFLLLLILTSPDTIEESAKGFVRYQIEKEVQAKQEIISQSTTAEKALNIATKLGFEKEKTQQDLNNKLPEKNRCYDRIYVWL